MKLEPGCTMETFDDAMLPKIRACEIPKDLMRLASVREECLGSFQTASRRSLPEVVGDAGLLVEPHDIEGIARAAERLTTDAALRTDLIRRGRLRAGAFTWERTARETLAVYREVLQAGDQDFHRGSSRARRSIDGRQ